MSHTLVYVSLPQTPLASPQIICNITVTTMEFVLGYKFLVASSNNIV